VSGQTLAALKKSEIVWPEGRGSGQTLQSGQTFATFATVELIEALPWLVDRRPWPFVGSIQQ